MQTGAVNVENNMEVSQKVKNRITPQSSNHTTGYLPKEYKNTNLKGYMHPMFITALFTIAKLRKQPKCPLIEEWINKMWGVYIYYSYIKKNKILPFATTWMELESIMLSKISQLEKDTI